MNTGTSKGAGDHRPGQQSAGNHRLLELLGAMEILLTFAQDHLEDAKKGGSDADLDLYGAEANMTSCFDLLHDCISLAERLE